jgi:hypothetical protein
MIDCQKTGFGWEGILFLVTFGGGPERVQLLTGSFGPLGKILVHVQIKFWKFLCCVTSGHCLKQLFSPYSTPVFSFSMPHFFVFKILNKIFPG